MFISIDLIVLADISMLTMGHMCVGEQMRQTYPENHRLAWSSMNAYPYVLPFK